MQQLKSAEWACVKLGNGIALFQALSNVAINGMFMCTCIDHCQLFHCVCVFVCVHVCVVCVGVVLGVVCHGGLLLTSDQLSAGQLMAFLVATQTIQRYLLVCSEVRVHDQLSDEFYLARQ